MSHRYRSHCCCGTGDGDPGDPDVITTNCHFGFGKPPKKFLDLSNRSGYANGAFDDTCYPGVNVFKNSYGGNPYDNHGYCSHDLNSELIVTIERVADGDVGFYGAYMIPLEYVACDDEGDGVFSEKCRKVTKTGIPRSTFRSFSNSPMYLRYRRLEEKFKDPAQNDTGSRDWGNHPGRPYERNYFWRGHGYGWGRGNFDNNVSSGDSRLPLYTNPFANPLLGPDDPFHPHGSCVIPFNDFGNLSRNLNGFANSDDILCTSTTPTYFGYYNTNYCAKMRGLGVLPKPLTLAQEQLIGFPFAGTVNDYQQPFPRLQRTGDGWDTTKHGFIAPAANDPRSCDADRCPDDPCEPGEECPKPHFWTSREYGGRWFWLQGILDHNYYNTYNLETEENPGEEYTTGPRQKLYRNFILWSTSNIPGLPNVREVWSSYQCENPPAGLWDLNSTLLGVCNRITAWERYWDGRSRSSFNTLNEGTNPFPDGPNGYFPVDSDGNDLNLNSAPMPGYIQFACAGVPVFSWELWYLYVQDVVAPGGLVGDPIVAWEKGLRSLVPDSVIRDAPDPDKSILFHIVSQFPPLSLEVAWASNLLGMDTVSLDSKRKSHFQWAMGCFQFGIDLPAEVTDIWERAGILPPPKAWGEEYDYKLFRKKMRYFDPTYEGEVVPKGCCYNLHSTEGALGYGNSSLPWKQEDADVRENPPGFSREFLLGLTNPDDPGEPGGAGGGEPTANKYCEWYPGLCDQVGTIHKPTENIISRGFTFTHPATDDLGRPDPLAGISRFYVLGVDFATDENAYITETQVEHPDFEDGRKVWLPINGHCLGATAWYGVLGIEDQDDLPRGQPNGWGPGGLPYEWNYFCLPNVALGEGNNSVAFYCLDENDPAVNEYDVPDEEIGKIYHQYIVTPGFDYAIPDRGGSRNGSAYDNVDDPSFRSVVKYMEENTRSRSFCIDTLNPFQCRGSFGGQVLGTTCDNTKPDGYPGTQQEWEAEGEVFFLDPRRQSFCYGPSGTSTGSCCGTLRAMQVSTQNDPDAPVASKYIGCFETTSEICMDQPGDGPDGPFPLRAPEIFTAAAPNPTNYVDEDGNRCEASEQGERDRVYYFSAANYNYEFNNDPSPLSGWAAYTDQYVDETTGLPSCDFLGDQYAVRSLQSISTVSNPPPGPQGDQLLPLGPDYNQILFDRFSNCDFDGLICKIGQSGGIPGWQDGIEEGGLDIDPFGGCLSWGQPITKDFFFYGSVGGWREQLRLCDGQHVATGLHPDNVFPTCGAVFFPAPFPVETDSRGYSPLPQSCCPQTADGGCEDYNNGWCLPVLFTICDNAELPTSYGGASNVEIPNSSCAPCCNCDTTGVPDKGCAGCNDGECVCGNVDGGGSQDPGIITTCTSYATSGTCRGAWWQFQANDYWVDDYRRAGCDLANNCFFLVQDPYEIGTRHEYKIDVVDGVTQPNWFYLNPVTENQIPTSAAVCQQGYRNELEFGRLKSSLYENYLKYIGAEIINDDGDFEVFLPKEFLERDDVYLRDFFGDAGGILATAQLSDLYDSDWLNVEGQYEPDDEEHPNFGKLPIAGVTMTLTTTEIYARSITGNDEYGIPTGSVLTTNERWRYVGDGGTNDRTYEFNPFEQLDRLEESRFISNENGGYAVNITLKFKQTNLLRSLEDSDGFNRGQNDRQVIRGGDLYDEICGRDPGDDPSDPCDELDSTGALLGTCPGCSPLLYEMNLETLIQHGPSASNYVTYAGPAKLVSVEDLDDYNGTDQPGDPEYYVEGCDLFRIKYSGIAARSTEYQWYYPPYAYHRGDPAEVYVCGPVNCEATIKCKDYRRTAGWGQCPNSISIYYGMPWKTGRRSGPPGTQTSFYDPIYPPKP